MNTAIPLRTWTYFLLTLSIFMLSGCQKDDNSSAKNILTSKVWKRGLTDKNISTNPYGGTVYYSVKDCEKDDTFEFDADGGLTLKRNENKCIFYEPEAEVLSYTLNRKTKKLTIDGNVYLLLEESADQIKYCTVLPPIGSYDYVVYLLQ